MAAANTDVIAADAVDLQLEAMRKDDCSWHPCQVHFSPNGAGLVIKYENNGSQDILVSEKEALMRIRARSLPLQGDDCHRIEPGEHVVVNQNSQSETGFFDAEVEKALPVRHSKRMHCRCTFMIRWLHQDLNNGSLKVPSTSVMRLANKSINNHPTISAFVDAVAQNSSFSGTSPQLNVLNDFDLDLHDLLEKQIEGIKNSVHGSKKRIKDEILGSDGKPPNPTPPVIVEFPENKSPLNPLAARAALASLMSKLPKTLEVSRDNEEGKVFDSSNLARYSSSGIDDVITIDNLASEIEGVRKPLRNVKKSLFSTSGSSSTTGTRLTRTKALKINGISDDNIERNKLSSVTNRRFTRAVLGKDEEKPLIETSSDHKVMSDECLFTTPPHVAEVDSVLTARRKTVSKMEEEKIRTVDAKNSGTMRRVTRSTINEVANIETEPVKDSGGDGFPGNKKRNMSGEVSYGSKKNCVDLKKQKVRSSPRFLPKT